MKENHIQNTRGEKMIKIERQSTELTNKKTIEKEIILNNKITNDDLLNLSQEFSISKDAVIQVLEHELNIETDGILRMLYTYKTKDGRTLLDLYLDEFNKEIKEFGTL